MSISILLSYIVIDPHYFELLDYNFSIKRSQTLQTLKPILSEYLQSKVAFANWFARTRSPVFKTASYEHGIPYAIGIQNKVVGAISHKCLRHM